MTITELTRMFLLAIWEVDPAQNLAKYKRRLCVLVQISNRNIAITYYMQSMSTKQKMCWVKDLPT